MSGQKIINISACFSVRQIVKPFDKMVDNLFMFAVKWSGITWYKKRVC
jgi:hypothetical protein